MQKRLFIRLFIIALALSGLLATALENAVTAGSKPDRRALGGAELQRLLPGNTLLGYDRNGPFWMYYPDRATIWGQASNGDVDVGRWWVKEGRYCRAWRRWFGGAAQCWTLAAQGQHLIVWLGDGQQEVGTSVLEPGNSIGRAVPSQQVASTTDLPIDPPSPQAASLDGGNATGAQAAAGTGPGIGEMDGGSGRGVAADAGAQSGGKDSSSAGGSSGGTGSGGTGSGGTGSGGTGSGGTGSGGTGSGGGTGTGGGGSSGGDGSGGGGHDKGGHGHDKGKQ